MSNPFTSPKRPPPLSQLPRILAKDRKGLVHVTRATYADCSDTLCGQYQLPCGLFFTEGNAEVDHARMERCPTCFPPSFPPSFTCPKCNRTSYNPNDVAQGYCGACHDWTRP